MAAVSTAPVPSRRGLWRATNALRVAWRCVANRAAASWRSWSSAACAVPAGVGRISLSDGGLVRALDAKGRPRNSPREITWATGPLRTALVLVWAGPAEKSLQYPASLALRCPICADSDDKQVQARKLGWSRHPSGDLLSGNSSQGRLRTEAIRVAPPAGQPADRGGGGVKFRHTENLKADSEQAPAAELELPQSKIGMLRTGEDSRRLDGALAAPPVSLAVTRTPRPSLPLVATDPPPHAHPAAPRRRPGVSPRTPPAKQLRAPPAPPPPPLLGPAAQAPFPGAGARQRRVSDGEGAILRSARRAQARPGPSAPRTARGMDRQCRRRGRLGRRGSGCCGGRSPDGARPQLATAAAGTTDRDTRRPRAGLRRGHPTSG
jgi:hypothetical protein